MMGSMKGAIFDLDGVIVDTAKYHFLAWRSLAEQLNIEFTAEDNELLKGVSRMRSLDIILDLGGIQVPAEEKEALARKKNDEYLSFISQIDEQELLPGAKSYLLRLRGEGIKIALGSASKNAVLILKKLNIIDLFDAIVDGNKVSKAKPDPEVFLLGCKELQLEPGDCVVYEDAAAGVQAAKAAGMRVIGIGERRHLPDADMVVRGLFEL